MFHSAAISLGLFFGTATLPALSQDFSMMSNWAQGQMINDNLQRNLANSGNAAPRSNGPVPYAVGPGIRTPKGVTNGAPIPIGNGAQPQTGYRSAPTTVANGAATSYQASPEVTMRVRGQFVNFIRTTSGEQAATALNTELQSKDYLRMWAQHASQDGLRLGDVADAFTAYWVENWQMANHVMSVQPSQVQAVRRQVSSTMTTNPGFARLNNAQKQEIAEIFIYNQIVQDANYVAAMKRNDNAVMQRLADTSVARFEKEMHLNLRQITLTDTGFAPVRQQTN